MNEIKYKENLLKFFISKYTNDKENQFDFCDLENLFNIIFEKKEENIGLKLQILKLNFVPENILKEYINDKLYTETILENKNCSKEILNKRFFDILNDENKDSFDKWNEIKLILIHKNITDEIIDFISKNKNSIYLKFILNNKNIDNKILEKLLTKDILEIKSILDIKRLYLFLEHPNISIELSQKIINNFEEFKQNFTNKKMKDTFLEHIEKGFDIYKKKMEILNKILNKLEKKDFNYLKLKSLKYSIQNTKDIKRKCYLFLKPDLEIDQIKNIEKLYKIVFLDDKHLNVLKETFIKYNEEKLELLKSFLNNLKTIESFPLEDYKNFENLLEKRDELEKILSFYIKERNKTIENNFELDLNEDFSFL